MFKYYSTLYILRKRESEMTFKRVMVGCGAGGYSFLSIFKTTDLNRTSSSNLLQHKQCVAIS